MRGQSLFLGWEKPSTRGLAATLLAEATVLNDLTATSTPATNAVDPVTGERCLQNLTTYSQDTTNAAWTKFNTTSSISGVAPDGTATANRALLTVTNNSHNIGNITASVSVGVTYTMSFYFKADTVSIVQIAGSASAFGSNAWANFDLANGAVGSVGSSATASIAAVGNGWYRCRVTAAATATTTGGPVAVFIQTLTDGRSPGFLGVGTEAFLLWGAQLVQGSVPGLYAPTTTAAALPRRRRPFLVAGRSVLADLVEGSRQNLLTYSNDFTNAAWNKFNTSIVANAAVAPDGTNTASKIREDGATASHIISNSVTITAVSHCFSIYLKAAERTWAFLRLDDGSIRSAYINLTTGAAGTITGANFTISAAAVGNGWWRVTVRNAAPIAAPYFCVVGPATGNGANNYAGDGTSGILAWGAQLEQAAFPSTYIPTTTAAVARGADSLSVSLASLPGGGLSTTAGTILALAVPEGWDSGSRSDQWRVFASANKTMIQAGLATVWIYNNDTGGAQIATGVNPLLVNRGSQSLAEVWDAASVRGFVAGSAAGTPDTTLTPPWLADTGSMFIGHSSTVTNPFHGWVALLYWPRALSATEIAILAQNTSLGSIAVL